MTKKEENKMKKKLVLTVLSSVLTLGILGACGENAENEPKNNDPMINDNGEMNEEMNNGGTENNMENAPMNDEMENEEGNMDNGEGNGGNTGNTGNDGTENNMDEEMNDIVDDEGNE